MQRRNPLAGIVNPHANAPSPCCACSNQATRRNVLALSGLLGSALAFGISGVLADPADERPKEGDQLVAVGATELMALSPGDIPASQILAWPMEPDSNLVRNGSRLNKILLVKLDPASLAGPTRERAADGVVAYSAICPHAGCEVDGWVAEQRILECPCHNSRYDPRNAAAIIDGPTTRALAALPLKIVNGKLTVAQPFIGRVGIAPA
ncbi:MAG TPA: Rieske (2Fe-2S) protein [Xanthobacteraceae bacterium]|jgi:Rieske Fe-S protein